VGKEATLARDWGRILIRSERAASRKRRKAKDALSSGPQDNAHQETKLTKSTQLAPTTNWAHLNSAAVLLDFPCCSSLFVSSGCWLLLAARPASSIQHSASSVQRPALSFGGAFGVFSAAEKALQNAEDGQRLPKRRRSPDTQLGQELGSSKLLLSEHAPSRQTKFVARSLGASSACDSSWFGWGANWPSGEMEVAKK